MGSVPPLLLAGVAGRAAAQATQPAPAGRAAGGAIRLAGNENPYGPGAAARAAIAAAVDDSWKYPIAEEMAFKAAIAEREGLTPRHVMIGAGSSEILHIAALLAAADGGELVTAVPTFSYVAEQVRALGGGVREVPLDERMGLDLAALRAAVTPATRLVYVCNPNNPTGARLPGAPLRRFIGELPPAVTVLVDEAYLEIAADMATESMADRVKAGASVIVARTFSKLHGLAGLRIGYALAPPELIERMARLRLLVPSSLGLAAAAASYADLAFQAETRGRIAESLAVTTAALAELRRPCVPSSANFVFFDTGAPVGDFLAAMRQRGFALGRPFPPYGNWCRVSMGTVEQMRLFAAALRGHFGA